MEQNEIFLALSAGAYACNQKEEKVRYCYCDHDHKDFLQFMKFGEAGAILKKLAENFTENHFRDATKMIGDYMVTDSPKNNVETMLNYAYTENREVMLRDVYGNGPKPLHVFCAECCECCEHPRTAEEFLNDGPPDCECLIPLLYILGTQAAELRERLRMWEDADKEEKLKE